MNGILYAYGVLIKRNGNIFPEILNGIICVDQMYSSSEVANLVHNVNYNMIKDEFSMEFKRLQMIGVI